MLKVASRYTDLDLSVSVNRADVDETESVYLTVTGTSAEAGDDGQVGRGNRPNGIITPYRPMTLEAAAGKNPTTHVGKIYNIAAWDIARKLSKKDGIEDVHVYLVSAIGAPVNEPRALEIRARTKLKKNEPGGDGPQGRRPGAEGDAEPLGRGSSPASTASAENSSEPAAEFARLLIKGGPFAPDGQTASTGLDPADSAHAKELDGPPGRAYRDTDSRPGDPVMPSKAQMLLIVLICAGGAFGASRVDWTRDVPYYPPEVVASMGGIGMPSLGGMPGERPGVGDGGGGGGLSIPEPPDDEGEENVHIHDLTLTRINSDTCQVVDDPGDQTMVLIRVDKEGALRWGGIAAGGYDAVADLLGKNAAMEGFRVVVVPDEMAPWQYVYWLLELAREKGVYDVAIGVTPATADTDGTLLAAMATPLPSGEVKIPSDMVELEIALKWAEDGSLLYTVFDQEAEDRQKLYNKIGSYNFDYADEFGGEYCKDVNNTPWVVIAPPDMPTGEVLNALEAARHAAVYTVRFGGEFPSRPGRPR